MIDDVLALGNKIEMSEIDMSIGRNNHESRMYVSQLLEFDESEEDVLYIAMPIYEGKLIPLEIGRKFELHFYAKKGMYSCKSEIINRYKAQNIYVLVVRVLSDLKKNQRRQFYRLQTSMEIKYKVLTSEDEKYFRTMRKMPDDLMERPYDIGTSIDISGGGIKFVSKDNISVGSKMFVCMELDLDDEIKRCEPIAKLVTSIPSKGQDKFFENRIEFVQIKDSDREALIKYIFKAERNMRKKQLE